MNFVYGIINAMLALGLSLFATIQLRGRNYSDVGVPMFSHWNLATAVGIFVYAICAVAGCLGLRKKKLLKDSSIFIIIHAALLPLDLLVVRLAVNF